MLHLPCGVVNWWHTCRGPLQMAGTAPGRPGSPGVPIILYTGIGRLLRTPGAICCPLLPSPRPKISLSITSGSPVKQSQKFKYYALRHTLLISRFEEQNSSRYWKTLTYNSFFPFFSTITAANDSLPSLLRQRFLAWALCGWRRLWTDCNPVGPLAVLAPAVSEKMRILRQET